MAKEVKEPELLDTYRSHWIALGRHGMEKEEVYPRFRAEWRGEPVVVTMSCDRYADSEYRIGTWRVYASEARHMTADDPTRGPSVTDTARSRLNDQCKPYALAWLESDQYRDSERSAYVYAVKREFSNMRGMPSNHVRDIMATVADKLGTKNVDKLTTLCAAWDNFVRVLDGI